MVMIMDINFKKLVKNLKAHDYRIICREVKGSTLAVIAPHGGGIEPGTTEISQRIARDKYHYYTFMGKKYRDNDKLHLKSTLFDEPGALNLLKKADTCLALHGCKEEESFIYTGGRDKELLYWINSFLRDAKFEAVEAPGHLAAQAQGNICNLTRGKKGVQLELSYGLRKKMFENVDRRRGRKRTTSTFDGFLDAVNRALDCYYKGLKDSRVEGN